MLNTVIEWELEPVHDEVSGKQIKKRIWQTKCQKLRLTQTTRQKKLVATAEIETDFGYQQCEKSPVGVGYVLYYNTLRDAAEAAERTLAGGSTTTTNREDMLLIALNWHGGAVVASKSAKETTDPEQAEVPTGDEGQDETMAPVATASRNGVEGIYHVKEADARRLIKAMGAVKKSEGPVSRIEDYLNEVRNWAEVAQEVQGEDKKLFKRIANALEEGDVIEIVSEAADDVSDGDAEVAKQETIAKKATSQEVASDDGEDAADAEEQPQCPWQVVSEKLMKLTPALVERFHTMKPFPRDRKVRKGILTGLREAFDLNTYRGGELASIYVSETQETYRGNGKHTCIVANEWIEDERELPDVKMLVREYEVETMEQAVDLYNTFDVSFSSRSKGDNIRTYASARENLEGMSDATLKLVTPAISYSKWGKEHRKRSTHEQTHLMLENAEFVVWLDGIMKSKKEAKHLWRVPVVAAMYRTWVADPEESTKFWLAVRHGDDEKKAVANKLKSWLEDHTFGASQGEGRAEDREGLWQCVSAWNAYRDASKKYLSNKYTSEVGIPDCV